MRHALAALALAATLPAPVIGQEAPARMPARPQFVPLDPAQSQSFAAQRDAFNAYQDCVAQHRPEVDLHNASRQLVEFRDHPAMLEGALQAPGARERAPGGAAEVMERSFAQYRALGGVAASIAEVTETPTPCSPPTLEPRRAPPGGSAPLSAHEQKVVPPPR